MSMKVEDQDSKGDDCDDNDIVRLTNLLVFLVRIANIPCFNKRS